MELNSFMLEGRRAVITGAAKGLGEQMAKAMARVGADISILDIDIDNAEKVAGEIEAMGRKALAVCADVSIPGEVKDAFSKTIEAFGGIDILVNDAGVSGHVPIEDMPLEEWNRVMGINLNGTFLCSQAAATQMIKQKTGGKIINVSSMSAIIVNRGSNNSHYCTSKAAVSQFTKCAACDWAKYKINVNAIAPSYFATKMAREAGLDNPDIYKRIVNSVPLGRVAQPEEIGGIVIFLASSASDYVTGATILIDGAYTCW